MSAIIQLCIITGWSIPLMYHDIKTHLLPNKYVFGCLFMLYASSLVYVLSAKNVYPVMTASIVHFVLFLFYLLLFIITREKIGAGDVKYSLCVGYVAGWLGFDVLPALIFMPFFVAMLFVFMMILLKQITFRSVIPFGPFMYLGMCVVLATNV